MTTLISPLNNNGPLVDAQMGSGSLGARLACVPGVDVILLNLLITSERDHDVEP